MTAPVANSPVIALELPKAKSLVLVVGAGASTEVGLPTGHDLKKHIASALRFKVENGFNITGGDSYIKEALSQLSNKSRNINDYLRAATLIQGAMPQAISIDNFIDSHREDERVAQCGKLAIASCILKAEQNSLLNVNRQNIHNKINFSNVSDTWFNLFFQLIAQNAHLSDLEARLDQVVVISFNYDRCLEHFLHQSLQNYYSISSTVATSLLKRLSIYHPYGTVGSLPWTEFPSSIQFGEQPTAYQLLNLVEQLKTFTESTDESSSEILAIRSVLKSADRVAFLGFAYHPLNLELLFGKQAEAKSAQDMRIYGTAKGISKSNLDHIKNNLSRMGGYAVRHMNIRDDLTAAQLFSEYSRSLTLE